MARNLRAHLQTLFQKQKGLCAICREPMNWVDGSQSRATVDHKIPRSRGGRDHIGNLRAACFKCNNARGDAWWPSPNQKPKPSAAPDILAAAIRARAPG